MSVNRLNTRLATFQVSLQNRPMKPRRTPADYRLQGIAAALAELSHAHMQRDLALLVLESLTLSVDDLKKAGADRYDLEALKK
jgi:hypothetical protein